MIKLPETSISVGFPINYLLTFWGSSHNEVNKQKRSTHVRTHTHTVKASVYNHEVKGKDIEAFCCCCWSEKTRHSLLSCSTTTGQKLSHAFKCLMQKTFTGQFNAADQKVSSVSAITFSFQNVKEEEIKTRDKRCFYFLSFQSK